MTLPVWIFRLIALISISFFLCGPAFAEDLGQRFPAGSGARFSLNVDGVSGEAVVYVSQSSPERVGIETYFSASGLLEPVQMWQQTVFQVLPGGRIQPRAHYLQTRNAKYPQQMRLPANSDSRRSFQLSDFLFADAAALERHRVGKETVVTPAGTVQATHYRQRRGDDQIDYWIAEGVGPLGIVKVVRVGEEPFVMELRSLVKNVKPHIDPERAVGTAGPGLPELPLGLSFLP